MAIDTSEKRRRSLNATLHSVPVPLYPFAYDGTRIVDRTHIAGLYYPAHNMQYDHTVYYAVELSLRDQQQTIEEIGLKGGFFRWITGRPGFDGTTDVFKENGEKNTDKWYEGILIKDGLSNPSRRIDIKDGGDYATLNGFNFSVRNDRKFWDYLEKNKIYIANSTVTLYVVLNKYFYSIWQGVVSATSYTETDFQFNCESNFKVVHKQFPPVIVTPDTIRGVNEKAIGEVIPVCLGDIPYAKALNVSGPIKETKLVSDGNKEYTVCAASAYSSQYLTLKTAGKAFGRDVLKGMYLRIIKGAGDDYYMITSNFKTDVDGNSSINNVTRIKLDTNLNDWSSDCAYKITSGKVSEKVWYFQIVSAPVQFIISQKQIKKFVKDSGNLLAYNYIEGYRPITHAVLGHTAEYKENKNFKGPSVIETITEKAAARSVDDVSRIELEADGQYAELIDGERATGSLLFIDYNSDNFEKVIDVTIPDDEDWTDQLHLAADFDCLYFSNRVPNWGLTISACMKDSYGNVVDNDLLSSSDKSFTIRGLKTVLPAISKLNMISNLYYPHYEIGWGGIRFYEDSLPGYDRDCIWPQMQLSDTLYNVENITALDPARIKDLLSSSNYEKKIRLDIEIKAGNDRRLSGLLNVKEICFRAFISDKEQWIQVSSIQEITESEPVDRTELHDKRRIRSIEYRIDNQTAYKISFYVSVNSTLANATKINLCIDTDVLIYTFEDSDSETSKWSFSCKASRVLTDQTVVDENLFTFANGMSLDGLPCSTVQSAAYNFLPDKYYKGSSNISSLWPVVLPVVDSRFSQEFNIKELSRLNPDSMELIRKGAVTRNLSVKIRVQKNRNDQLILGLRQIGLVSVVKREFKEDDVYVSCNGEIVTDNLDSNSVYGAFYHILHNYDNLDENDATDFKNLPTVRNIWHLGRQITEQKSSFDYLKELCKQSFVGMFPSRGGNITLNAWLQQSHGEVPAFDENTIIRDSIKNFTRTSPQDLYNDFFISYAYNPGADKFDKHLFVTKAWKKEFPVMYALEGGVSVDLTGIKATRAAGSDYVEFEIKKVIVQTLLSNGLRVNGLVSFREKNSNVVEPQVSFYRGEVTDIQTGEDDYKVTIKMHGTAYSDCEEEIIISSGEITIHPQLYDELDAVTRVWATYVGGLVFSQEDELQVYEEARRLWSRCREGYKFVGRIQSAPDSVSNLKWYTEGNTDIGFTNSAFEFLKYLVYWTSRPKAQVEFTIPLNGYMKSQNGIMTGSRNLDLELLDSVYFSDQIYTNGQKRRGYITKIEPDTKKSEIKIGMILEPDDYSEVIVERGIPLNDPMPQIVESGTRDTVIVETGV